MVITGRRGAGLRELGAIAVLGALTVTLAPASGGAAGPVAARTAVVATTAATAATAAAHVFPIKKCHTSYGRSHHDYPATDIFAARGCRFVAPVAGVVDEVSRHDTWNPSTNKGSARGGKSVSIIGVDGVRYYGSHLESIPKRIKPGVTVAAGTVLGRVGNTGSARGIATHLHFGISWPTRKGVWWVRRGMVYPWPYLDSWRAHHNRSPATAVRKALRHAGKRVPKCTSYC